MVTPRPYSELDLSSIGRALDAVDAQERGVAPSDTVQRGLKAFRGMREALGIAETPEARRQTVSALARVYERDADMSRAPVGSLDAARMLVLDTSLQREAATMLEMDVLDRRDWMGLEEVAYRSPDWAEMDFPLGALRGAPESDLAAIAAGDMHAASSWMATYVELTMDVVRAPRGAQIEARLQEALGLIDPDQAREASRVSMVSGRFLRQKAEESRDWDRSVRPWSDAARDVPFETQEIAARSLIAAQRAEMRQRMRALSQVASFLAGAKVVETTARLPDATDVHRMEAISAMADATSAQPSSLAGKIVAVASRELRAAGFPESEVAGPGMEAATARMLSRESPNGEISLLGGMPGEQAARIVVDVAIQAHARDMLAGIEARERRGRPDQDDYAAGPAAKVLAEVGIVRMFVASRSEAPDLSEVATGRFGSVSDRSGIASQLDLAYSGIGMMGETPFVARMAKAYEGLQRADRVMREIGIGEVSSDAMTKLRSLSKGPVDVEAEGLWDRSRAKEAGR